MLGETIFNLEVADLKDFDVAVHVASLLAILIYFWRDLLNTKYWTWLILGTIPAVIVGFTLEDQIDAIFRSALSVGIVMIVLGGIFLIPEKFGQSGKKIIENKKGSEGDSKSIRTSQKGTWWRVLVIGLAQSVALIPGVSRSGSTIFTGKMLGLKREESARFSFMLGSIAIAGAGFLTALDLLDASELSLTYGTLSAGFIASFVASLTAVWWLMKFLKKHSLRVFGVYLVLIGTTTVILSL